jgi:hypothetical protein
VKKKTIRVVLRGGLGNQLFQYAAGFAQAQIRNCDLELDCSLLPVTQGYRDGHSVWPVQISGFSHSGELINLPDNARGAKIVRRLVDEFFRIVGQMRPEIPAVFGHFSFNGPSGEFSLDKVRNLRTINSYLASSAHFQGHEEQVKAQIRNLVNPSKKYLELKEDLAGSRVIGIHIRLGDYKQLEKIYGKYSPAYLRRCLEILEYKNNKSEIALFSDEPEEAAQILNAMGIRHRILSHSKLSPLEELLLLASCTDIVASNSTFSWWAAFLSTSDNPMIFFPRPFFADKKQKDPKDLLHPDWIQVGR